MPKVLIFGEFYSPNLGDGVIFDCEEQLFTACGVSVVAVDLSGRVCWEHKIPNENPQKAGLLRRFARRLLLRSRTLRRINSGLQWYFISRKKLSKLWEAQIQEADAVVIGGGQLLTDIGFGFTPKIYEVSKLARRSGTPIAFFGCGVGADGWSYLARQLYKRVFEDAKYVSVRDAPSAHMLRSQVVLTCPFEVHPDPAFYLPKPAPDAVSQTHTQTQSKAQVKKYSIAFNLQPAADFRLFVPELKQMSELEYLDFWYKLIRGARAENNTAIVLTNGNPTDYLIASKLVQMLRDNGIYVDLGERPLTPEDLLEQLGSTSRLVCTRMHAGIIAHGLGASVVAISWDKKVNGVWDAVGCGENVVPATVLLMEEPWPYFSEKMSLVEKQPFNLPRVQEQLVSSSQACIAALKIT